MSIYIFFLQRIYRGYLFSCDKKLKQLLDTAEKELKRLQRSFIHT